MISLASADCCLLEARIKEYMSNFDCSHDWNHIQRVRKMAKELALYEQSLGKSVDLELVDMAALLHDVGDVKYSKPGETSKSLITKILSECNYDLSVAERICQIVENVSYRKELENKENGKTEIYIIDIELACVQDADRLDAIGAIGIARCLAFNGARNYPIYLPDVAPLTSISSKQYNDANLIGTAINHFYEKLFLLGDLMKTVKGRELAKSRTEFMREFVNRMKIECDIPW